MLIRPYFKDNRGLTLVEVLVTVIIIGIISAIAVPNIQSQMAKFRLNTAANELKAEIRNARQLSISERDSKQIRFLTKETSKVYDRYTLRRSQDASIIKRVFLPKGVVVQRTNFTNNRLTFNILGNPTQGGTITMQNERGDILYVIVAVGTGRVRVDTKPPANWVE